MSTPTVVEILATFPEFATPPTGQSTYITLAEAEQADLWGDVRYNQAVALRAAHAMKRAGLGTGGTLGLGDVKSESIGSLSVTYGTDSASNVPSDLATTVYGRMLWELIAGALVTPMTSYDG